MTIFRRNKKRTIEALLVLAVLAIIASALVPYLRNLTEEQKGSAWQEDKERLQDAVTAYLPDGASDSDSPTIGGASGTPLDANGDGDFDDPSDVNSFIDIGSLSRKDLLGGSDTVGSADTTRNTTATNNGNGSYGWYLDAAGEVQGWHDADGDGLVDEGEVGYHHALYP
jgi:type II secretory pathway pseudopilin PulG